MDRGITMPKTTYILNYVNLKDALNEIDLDRDFNTLEEIAEFVAINFTSWSSYQIIVVRNE